MQLDVGQRGAAFVEQIRGQGREARLVGRVRRRTGRQQEEERQHRRPVVAGRQYLHAVAQRRALERGQAERRIGADGGQTRAIDSGHELQSAGAYRGCTRSESGRAASILPSGTTLSATRPAAFRKVSTARPTASGVTPA